MSLETDDAFDSPERLQEAEAYIRAMGFQVAPDRGYTEAELRQAVNRLARLAPENES